jgi:dipeptidyl aminopeptidase/acylaminoacyl peptidase
MLLALSLAAIVASPIPPRRLVPEDVFLFRTLSSLEVSPDGKTLVYGIERADDQEDEFVYELWSMPADGGKPKRICDAERSCRRPRFSQDGSKLAWLESDGEATQIVVAKAGSKRGRMVTSGDESAGDFDWSPDGTSLVFTRNDPYIFRPAPGAPQPSGEDASKEESAPHVITRTQILRDGEGFLDTRHTHLYVVSAKGGEAKRITSGAYDDDGPRWSPRGDAIAFVSNRGPDPDANDDTDIYVVASAGGTARKLAGNPGPDAYPVWSRAGDRLAFVGALRPNDYYQIGRVMVVPVAGGTPVDLTGALDMWPATDNVVSGSGAVRPMWTRDDAEVLVPLARKGASWLASVPSGGGAPREILGGAEHHGLVRLAAATGRLYYLRTTPGVVSDLWTAGADGTGARKLFGPNDDVMPKVRLSTPKKLEAKSTDGTSVAAWLYPPLDLEPAKKYPMILYIHGGPQEYDGELFDTGLENQIFPGKGWAVLRVNYRGSTSYGEAFSRALWADWHTREYDDLMAAVDAAIAGNPWIDAERLGIGGWSYGGIMTIWTVGHTKRFKVGVPERFEVDYLSCFGTDQWQQQYLAEMGDPLKNAETYRTKSPGTYLPEIETPLYLIANEDDANCPPTQAMQLYQRLKLRGVPTELVIYPDENHSMTTPSHYVDRLYRLIDWFGRELK